MSEDVDGDSFMVEEITPEGWHNREVYAKFGLAVYEGQVLEHEIVNLIIWSGIGLGVYRTREETEAADVELFRKTMGTLKKELLSRRIDLGHLEDELIRAVTLRNFLAHRYFRERAAAFMSEEGRDQMIQELDRAAEFFGEMDAKLTPFTLKMVEKFGLLDKLPEFMKENEEAGEFGEPLPGLG
jgi:hypothetical protein